MNKIKKLALFFAIILIFPISIVFGADQNIKNIKDIQPTGFFNDFTNTIASDSAQNIESTLSAYSAQTTNQIVVVMIDTLGEEDLSQYANELFRDWGIGSKGKNNGVLFLIAKDDRKMRIEVGYGLEGDLTDIETKHIQDDIVAPFFKQGDYFSGINAGVDAMISGIGTELNVKNVSTVNILEKHFMTAFYIFLIFISFLVSTLAKSKSWWAGGVVGAIGGIVILYFSTLIVGIVSIIGLTILGLFFDRLVSRKYKDHKDNGTNFPWWMGGMGSGGFSGFGGGSSGGGGSSSSW